MDEKIEEMLLELKNDNRSGANELIDLGIKIIKTFLASIDNEELEIKHRFYSLARDIIDARPSMAPLHNAIAYLISDIDKLNKKNMSRQLVNLTEHRSNLEKNLKKQFRKLLNRIKKESISFMTLSYSSTILNLLLNSEKNNFEIYILESRPLFEGRRTAKALSKQFETHLIVDAAMGKYIDKIDYIIVGIDSILKSGAIINKIGTYLLSVLAKEKMWRFLPSEIHLNTI